VPLKTSTSPDPTGPRKHRCSTGRRAGLALVCAALVPFAGCGGGELSGQSADAPATTPAAQAPPATTPGVATTSTTATPSAPARTTTRPARTTPTTVATTPAPATTPSTQPPATTAQPAPEPDRAIEETAELELVEKISAVEYRQRGDVTGTYDGEMTLHAKVGSYIYVRFTVTVPGGTVTGRARAVIRIEGDGPQYPIQGTAAISEGTGRFAGVRGRGLELSGRAALDGTRGRVRLSGTVSFD